MGCAAGSQLKPWKVGTRKRRWRSSQLSIDIVSKHYFFQGEIYKGASAPIFLDQLEFNVPQGYQADLEKAYQKFLSMVEERKRKALYFERQITEKKARGSPSLFLLFFIFSDFLDDASHLNATIFIISIVTASSISNIADR